MEQMTLEDAISRIPQPYEVSVRRHANEGGWYFFLSRKMLGGELTILGRTCATWQEAFNDVFNKL